MVFPTYFQFKHEFYNKESIIWATVRSVSCFCWLYRASPFFACNRHNKFQFGIDHLVISIFGVVGKGYDQHVLLINSVSFCPASICTPRPNLLLILDISWLPTFAFQSPVIQRISLMILVLEDVVSLYTTCQFNFLVISGWGTGLDCCDIEWFALETNRLFCCFWGCTHVLYFRLFWWLCLLRNSFLLRDSCPLW